MAIQCPYRQLCHQAFGEPCGNGYDSCMEYRSWLRAFKQYPIEEFVEGIGTVRVFVNDDDLRQAMGL